MRPTAVRTLAAVACSAAIAFTLTGCGDGDDKKDEPTTLTETEFKTQANAICKAQDENEARTFSVAQQAGQAGDTAKADEALKDVAEVIRGEANALADLNAPDSLKADVQALLKSLNDDLDQIESEGTAALLDGALSDASDKATALGLTECGN